MSSRPRCPRLADDLPAMCDRLPSRRKKWLWTHSPRQFGWASFLGPRRVHDRFKRCGLCPSSFPSELFLRLMVGSKMSNPEIKTERIHRTWFERLKMWRHAYEAKVFDGRREAVGRGPTPAAARDAALKRWNEHDALA